MTTVVSGPVAAGPGSATHEAAVERMLATVHRLAADEFTGRRVGTPGGRAAAAWLADQLRDVGAAVTGIGMGLPGYQTPAETPDRVQPDTLLAAARLIVTTVQNLAAMKSADDE